MATIAIDYDDTITSDPETWAKVIELLRQKHDVLCCTFRTPAKAALIELPIPVYATDGVAKAEYMRNQGVWVDIWIDDWPELIGPTRVY